MGEDVDIMGDVSKEEREEIEEDIIEVHELSLGCEKLLSTFAVLEGDEEENLKRGTDISRGEEEADILRELPAEYAAYTLRQRSRY